MIDESKLERAMNFLAGSDAAYAAEKAQMLRDEILCKRVRARALLECDGKTVDERKAQTETHPDVIEADESYVASVQKFETLKAQRERAEIVIDVWRSLEASRRKS